MIGDLAIIGTPPPKLGAALRVIEATMHEAYEAKQWIKPGISYRSCILASLTVRDFLRRLGFAAEVKPVLCYIDCHTLQGEVVHTLGIGTNVEADFRPRVMHPGGPGWSGHLVCVADGWLIDTTLYQARRPMWSDLPGMMALALDPAPNLVFGLDSLSGLASVDAQNGNRRRIVWLDQPRNKFWRKSNDSRPARRQAVIRKMVEIMAEAEQEQR